MAVLAILAVIVLALLAAILRLAGRVLGEEGFPVPARRCTLLAAGFAALAVIGAATVALAHDPYTQWRQPDTGASCCNGDDCRPTRAFLGDDGLWRAWDGRQWLVVPLTKMLPPDMAKDGRSHLCATPGGTVFCFSPTWPKG